jgi:ethanolamine ammonia-lyase large subunit
MWGTHYNFKDLKELMAKASEVKSGDQMAGLAAQNARERVVAKTLLADVALHELRENPVVPYEKDEVTRLAEDSLDIQGFNKIKNWSISELREWILQDTTTGPEILEMSNSLTPEMAASVAKLMSNMDLVIAGRKIRVIVKCNSTLGLEGRISSRLQTNHPTDQVDGIITGAKEGLSYAVKS